MWTSRILEALVGRMNRALVKIRRALTSNNSSSMMLTGVMPRHINLDQHNYFSLDLDLVADYLAINTSAHKPRYTYITDRMVRSRFAIIQIGEKLTAAKVKVSADHILKVRFALPPNTTRNNSSSLVISYFDAAQGYIEFAKIAAPHPTSKQEHPWSDINLSLASLSGQEIQFSLSPLLNDICISYFVICPEYAETLIRGCTNYYWRLKNESSHFSGDVYHHAMYKDGQSESSFSKNQKIKYEIKTAISATSHDANYLQECKHYLAQQLEKMEVNPNELAYNFGMRCLGSLLPISPPNFFDRIKKMSSTKPLKILSICSGDAHIEKRLLENCDQPIEITLLDANLELTQRAAKRLSNSTHTINYLIGDINDGLPGEELYDIVICVSALHHIVNLELILSQINRRLNTGGEFWSIGEQIGRNGNRLWPDAKNIVDHLFSTLPQQYRKNAHTQFIDHSLPDCDFSTESFEGIRSEEIDILLDSYFLPIQTYKRNCFLWRMLDTAYLANYDLNAPSDVQLLKTLVVEEVAHWISGGRPTELHAIYSKKDFHQPTAYEQP